MSSDRARHRISVLQPPASGVGGKSWEEVWAGDSAFRALAAFLVAVAARHGRQLRLEWGRGL